MDKCVLDYRSQTWLGIITACSKRNPAQSKQDWCRENGIQPRQFYYWQQKLRDKAAEVVSSGLVPAQQQEVDPAIQFTDVTDKVMSFSENNSSRKMSVATEYNFRFAAEILLEVEGARVYLNQGFHEQTLKKVLQVLKND